MAKTASDLSGSALQPRSRRWRDLLREPVASICMLFIVFQLVCIVGALLFPEAFRYLSPQNVALLQRAIPVIGVVALGVGLLMITGEYDLSVGSVYTLAGYSMAMLYTAGVSPLVALVLTLLIGIVIGIVNGIVTVKTGIPSFIATMGSMLLVRGLVRWLSEMGSVSFRPGEAFASLFTGSLFGVEAAFIWFIMLALAAAVFLHRSKIGNHMYLVGGNERTARAVGIATDRVKIVAFALSGMAAAIAGVLSITRVGTATPAQGLGMELRAIAVCVIGGLFLSGGRGTVLGIVVGACILYMVEDVLLLLRAPGFYLDVFVGAILVIAVIANTALARRSAK